MAQERGDYRSLAAGERARPVEFAQLRIADDVDDGEAGSIRERIRWGGGVALPVRRARLAIAGQEAAAAVAPQDDGVAFTLHLPAGPAHLQTWFELEDGDSPGAFCIYVEQTGAEAEPD